MNSLCPHSTPNNTSSRHPMPCHTVDGAETLCETLPFPYSARRTAVRLCMGVYMYVCVSV